MSTTAGRDDHHYVPGDIERATDKLLDDDDFVSRLHAGHGGVHDNDDHAIDYVLVRRDDYDRLVAVVDLYDDDIDNWPPVIAVLDIARQLIDHGPGEYDYGINDDDIDDAPAVPGG